MKDIYKPKVFEHFVKKNKQKKVRCSKCGFPLSSIAYINKKPYCSLCFSQEKYRTKDRSIGEFWRKWLLKK